MANIRKQFTENTNLNGYKRKKYVCKILYIYMLGYEVDFGYMEAINLLKSNKFAEKQIVRSLFIFLFLNLTSNHFGFFFSTGISCNRHTAT